MARSSRRHYGEYLIDLYLIQQMWFQGETHPLVKRLLSFWRSQPVQLRTQPVRYLLSNLQDGARLSEACINALDATNGSSLNGVGKAAFWVGMGSDRLGSSLL